MNKTIAILLSALLHFAFFTAPSLAADELPRIPSRTPQESAAMIKTIPGFKAELVAAEPLVFSPVAVDFDEDGRAFVCEMIDYPFPSKEPLGKVVVLEDVNGDGKFDKRTLLADKLHWPTAVICYDGGVFVGSAPDILYLKDKNGDGIADVRKTVFTGFGKQNVQGLLNSFRWGIDNRIHGATGTNGGKVQCVDLPPGQAATPSIDLRGRDFSFDPRLLDLRSESGGAQHGMSLDDFGRKFVSSNSDHIQQVVYDDRYLAKLNPQTAMPPARVSIAVDGPQAPVFRISPVEPWRVLRTRMRVSGEAKGIVEGGGQPAGYFTGATGVTIYRGDAFPDEYRGQAFIGDVGSNLIHRKVLKKTDGVLFKAERVDEGREFLASEDIWFRPAQFANAPDGTLYVLDVCREVIEHPDSLPDSIKQQLDLTSGRDRGRIYRVVPDGYQQRKPPRLSKASTPELVEVLKHRNGWHRDTASRLLYQRKDLAAAEPLYRLITSPVKGARATLPESRIAAMYALGSIGGADHLLTPLSDVFLRNNDLPIVLLHAVRLAEKDVRLAPDIGWLPRFDPELDLQRALSIAQYGTIDVRNWSRERVVADLARTNLTNDYQRGAVLGLVTGEAGGVFWDVIREPVDLSSAQTRGMIRSLARLSVINGDAGDISRIVKAVDAVLLDRNVGAAEQTIAGLIEGGRANPAAAPAFAGRVAEAKAAMQQAARQRAADSKANIPDRVAAIDLLKLDEIATTGPVLEKLLGGREPPIMQHAAISALGTFSDPKVGEILTAAWPRLTPALRPAAANVLLARPERALVLLSAIDKERIPARELEPAQLARLQQSKNAAVKKLADAVADKAKLSPRAEVVAAYKPATSLAGNIERGATLFTQHCAVCHRIGDVGTEIGPNLAAMKARGAEAIMVNVIDPNREVNGLFTEYVVETKDGRSLSGLLASETAGAVTLRKAGGMTETINRSDIEKMRSTGLSLMPEGLERQLDQQAMADLIAYLMK